MDQHGGLGPIENQPFIDYAAIAEGFIDNQKGTITPYGVVYDYGIEMEEVYDGKLFPDCDYIKIEERPNHRMKKYKVFRSLGKVDEDVRKHELVAVEYGADIQAVTDKLIQVINDDATGLPRYEKGYTAFTESPRRIGDTKQVKRYQYCMLAVLEPDYGEQNDLLEYGIIEEDAEAGAIADQD